MTILPINHKQAQKSSASVPHDLAWALPLIQAQKTPQAKQVIASAKALAEQRFQKAKNILFLVR